MENKELERALKMSLVPAQEASLNFNPLSEDIIQEIEEQGGSQAVMQYIEDVAKLREKKLIARLAQEARNKQIDMQNQTVELLYQDYIRSGNNQGTAEAKIRKFFQDIKNSQEEARKRRLKLMANEERKIEEIKRTSQIEQQELQRKLQARLKASEEKEAKDFQDAMEMSRRNAEERERFMQALMQHAELEHEAKIRKERESRNSGVQEPGKRRRVVKEEEEQERKVRLPEDDSSVEELKLREMIQQPIKKEEQQDQPGGYSSNVDEEEEDEEEEVEGPPNGSRYTDVVGLLNTLRALELKQQQDQDLSTLISRLNGYSTNAPSYWNKLILTYDPRTNARNLIKLIEANKPGK